MENKPNTRTLQINQIRTKNDQTNYIQTARYTLYNFLPYSLFNQFRNYYNIFFLASIGVYSIEIITPVQPLYESIPFIIVLIIAICRDGYEDYNKLQYDNVYNNSLSLAYNYTNEYFESIKWKDICIGQIIKVRRNEVIPADLVILKSSNDNGFAYMQTADLDGETNLKPREALTITQNLSYKEESIKMKINGSFEEQLPNKNIYEIEGCLMLNGQEKMYFNQSNCLLRSGILKNVDYIIGLVIYTGNDTKIMQNIKKEPQKLSKIDLLLNRTLFILLILIICLPCALTTVALVFQKKNDVDGDDLNMDYVFYRRYGAQRASLTLEFFQTLASFFYIFTLLIPISIMVSLELVKTFQTFQLNKDSAYRMKPDEKTKYLSMKLHENLGDVKYIFTDKTGTLTKNEMKFKTCSIFNQVFSEDKKEDDKNNSTCSTKAYLKNTLSKAFKDFIINKQDKQVILPSSVNDDNTNNDFDNSKKSELTFEEIAIDFFINIAINHNVLVATANKEEEKQIKGSYYGINPDEITLVQYAKDLGIEFVDRSVTSCRLKIFHHLYEYPILNRFDFTSERKRSSIIVRDPSGQIKMYMKGADNVILDKLNAFSKLKLEAKTKEHIDKFSSEGLRTLCFAMKTLTEKEYNDWSERYKEIQFKALGDKQMTHELENQIALIENDMLLVGVSGLKDLLQEDVSSCIYDFLQAEINVWMLTGDKLDTAESIGKSCKLINEESEVYKIYEKDCLKAHDFLLNIKSNLDVYSQGCSSKKASDSIYIEFQENLLEDTKIQSKNFSLIIEGESITQCLKEENSTLFFECVSQSRSVICSRCSPSQKADVVKFIKKHSKNLTLAIGDGGNDVNMLQSADIGIGIFGKEGSQAAYSSDFAFSQFKYLRRLLFVHGRFSISRNSYFVYYSFFKNVIELFTQFWHFFFSGYSGALFFDNIYVLAYNAFLAIILPCVYSIYEEDIDSSFTFSSDNKKDNETLMPMLYKEMRNSKPFSIIKFALVVFASIIFSLFFYFIPMLSYSTNILMDDGISLSLTDQSVASFLSILLFIYSMIFTDTYYFNHIVVGTYVVQFFLASGFLLFHYVIQGNLIIDKLWDIANTKLYLIVLLTFGVNYAIIFIIRSFHRLFSHTLVNQIRNSMDKEPGLPIVILPIQNAIGVN